MTINHRVTQGNVIYVFGGGWVLIRESCTEGKNPLSLFRFLMNVQLFKYSVMVHVGVCINNCLTELNHCLTTFHTEKCSTGQYKALIRGLQYQSLWQT